LLVAVELNHGVGETASTKHHVCLDGWNGSVDVLLAWNLIFDEIYRHRNRVRIEGEIKGVRLTGIDIIDGDVVAVLGPLVEVHGCDAISLDSVLIGELLAFSGVPVVIVGGQWLYREQTRQHKYRKTHFG